MSLPSDYSLETHGLSFATEESRALGALRRAELEQERSDVLPPGNYVRALVTVTSQRTLTRPAPVYAVATTSMFWRCDLEGYIAWDVEKKSPKGQPLGRLKNPSITLNL